MWVRRTIWMFRKSCVAAVMALALMSPAFGAKSHDKLQREDKPKLQQEDKPKPVAVPENWRVSDTLVFSAAALLAFGTLARLKVLRPYVSTAFEE